MVRLTQSLQHWLWENHRDKSGVIMENTIKEMAKLCPFHEEGKCNLLEDEAVECNFDCDMCDFAKNLYNAGYRKQEWISVDERLPETNEEVLVYSSVGKIYTACYIRVDGIEFWFENIDGFREITHWMPLPEAPKMKGEKNG